MAIILSEMATVHSVLFRVKFKFTSVSAELARGITIFSPCGIVFLSKGHWCLIALVPRLKLKQPAFEDYF